MSLPLLRVSSDHRRLVQADGTPFFYLADTAWVLFYKLGWEDTVRYLEDRAGKGFNAIQAVAIGELPGPNCNGDLPREGDDPLRPVEAYWKHVDRVVEKANALGLYVAFLPTWGDRWNRGVGTHPEVSTPENARTYGRWVGARYAGCGIIWVLGGDRPIESDRHRTIIREMAEGLAEGDGGRHLRTFHPRGSFSSSDYVHDEPWLDFNLIQSGHCTNSLRSYDYVAKDRARTPTKPTLDAEPCYEDHPMMNPDWTPTADGHRYTDWHVRRAAWWAVFSGACGQSYGAHPVWMMWEPGRPEINKVRITWREALALPGSAPMQFLRRFVEGLPTPTYEPAMMAGQAPDPMNHIAAMRGGTGASQWAAFYFPNPQPARVDLGFGNTKMGRWLDPSTGRWLGDLPDSAARRVALRPEDFPQPGTDAVLFFGSHKSDGN